MTDKKESIRAITYQKLDKADEDKIRSISEKIRRNFSKYVYHSKERDGEKRGLIWYERSGNARWEGIAGRLYDEETGLEIQIGTKFDKEKKLYFIAYLLLSAFGSGDAAPFGTSVTYNDLFRFLYIFMFKDKLKTAYSANIYKKYETFEQNDDRVRGHIDVSRHIKLNMGLAKGKIAYSYRERTADNNINRLILHTFELLRGLYPEMVSALMDSDSDFNAAIKSIQFICPSWQSENIRTSAAKSVMPITQPLFGDYEELRKLCLRIISNEGISIFDKDNDDSLSYTLLFYVPDYWELYLKKLIRIAIDEINRESDSLHLTLDSQKGLSIFSDLAIRRPDFVVFKSEGSKRIPYAVIDAKYKPRYKNDKRLSEENEDVDQILAYAKILGCDRLALAFPYDNNKPLKSKTYEISKEYDKSRFALIGVCVPTIDDNADFKAWSKKIKEDNERPFIDDVKEFLKEIGNLTQTHL